MNESQIRWFKLMLKGRQITEGNPPAYMKGVAKSYFREAEPYFETFNKTQQEECWKFLTTFENFDI